MNSNNVLLNSETYTYDYFLQDDVCRLCWSRDANRELLPKSLQKQQILKNELVDKIMDCLNLDFSYDSYPKKACNDCYLKVEQFHQFKTFCRETDRRLKEIVSKYHDKDVEESTCDVKIEKLDNEFPDFDLPKDTVVHQTDDYLYSLNDSDVLSDYQLAENERNTEETVPAKRKRYKAKRSATYCNICRLDLNTKESLSSHNSVSHGIEEDTGLFKCFGCEKRFKSRKTRLGHEINFCKGLKDGYKCQKCNRYLPKRRTYESHMRDHRDQAAVELPENIFQCTKCFKFFKTRDSLRGHMVEHNVDKKSFVCETCGRVFTRQDYLHKHKLTHTGTKQHVCPLCGFRTTQRSSLTVHIRKHTGERPYVCDVCPQRCVSSSNLRAHRRRHQGHKHYECTICNKKFGYKISLEEHVSACHERSRQFPCPHCTAVYTRARGLRRHLLAKHAKQHLEDGESRQKDKMAAEVYIKMADDPKKVEVEVIKEVAFEVKGSEEFVILNEEALVANMY